MNEYFIRFKDVFFSCHLFKQTVKYIRYNNKNH